MLDALGHRGPNDRGIYSNGNAVLGQIRLSIVDVAYGHQPILADSESKDIICNNEIIHLKNT